MSRSGRMLFAFLGVLGVVSLSSCIVTRPYRAPPRHVHGPRCGHVWRDGRWVVVKEEPPGHRHGPGCGHAWCEGRWIEIQVETPASPHGDGDGHCHHDTPVNERVSPPEHAHGPSCSHQAELDRQGTGDTQKESAVVNEKAKEAEPPAHVHGTGCGHVLRKGRWVKITEAPPGHQRKGPPGNFHGKGHGGRENDRPGHVHGSGCGHVFFDGKWLSEEAEADD